MKFWNTALEHGVKGTRSSLSILKLLCLSVLGDRCRPACNCSYILPEESSLCEYFLRCHIHLMRLITLDSLSSSIYHLHIINIIIIVTDNEAKEESLIQLRDQGVKYLKSDQYVRPVLPYLYLPYISFSCTLPVWGIIINFDFEELIHESYTYNSHKPRYKITFSILYLPCSHTDT